MAESTRTFTVDVSAVRRDVKAEYTATKDGKAQAIYIVTNTRAFAVRGVGNAVALDAAGHSWVQIAGDKEKDFQPTQAQSIQVDVLIPANTPKGVYRIRLVEANTADPAVDYTEGDVVNVAWPGPPVVTPINWRLIIAIAAIVLLAIGTGVFFFIHKWPVTVPDVVGETLEKAEADLKTHFRAKVQPADDSGDAPVGTVISQSPKAGDKAPANSEVQITPQGIKRILVHSYVGQPKTIAEAAFAALNLPVNEINGSQSNAAIGTVIGQDPGSDGKSTVQPGSTINLTIQGPPTPIPMPDIIGKVWETDGKPMMTTAHLVCAPFYTVTKRYAPGQVSQTSYQPQQPVPPSVTVQVQVEGVQIPSPAVRSTVIVASTLSIAGFQVRYGDARPPQIPPGPTVFSAVPPLGTVAMKGSIVTLFTRSTYVPPPPPRIDARTIGIREMMIRKVAP